MPIATDITLDEATHTYMDCNGKEYTSVSKIIARYKEPFDREAIAAKTAQKTGRTIEAVFAEWDTAAPYGTAVHRQMEGYFSDQDYGTDLIEPYIPTLKAWKDQPCKFMPETILYHDALAIAGTADLIVQRGAEWSIIDWKTNKEIYKNGFWGKKLKAPLDHLDDCNFIHYSLQLSMYAKLLGSKINKLSLVHIPRGKTTLERIPCPYFEREVNIIFDQLFVEKDLPPF